MSTTYRALVRLATLAGATVVALVAAAVAAAMPLVPEGDPPIKVRYAHGPGHSAAAVSGSAQGGGIDWGTVVLSAADAAAIVLLALVVALAIARARSRRRSGLAPTS